MKKLLIIFSILLSTQLYAKNSCDVVFQDDSGEVYKNTEECVIAKNKHITKFKLNESPALWFGRDRTLVIKSFNDQKFDIFIEDDINKKLYKIDISYIKAKDEVTNKICYIFDNFTYQFCYI